MACGIGLKLYLKGNKRVAVTHSEEKNKNKLNYQHPALLE